LKTAVLAIGTNEANTCGTTAGCQSNYQYGLQAFLGWYGVADSNKVYGSQCGTNAGWTTDAATIPQLPNVFEYSNVANATTSCTVTTGSHLQWSWMANDSAVAGACGTLKVDGAVVDTQCSKGFNGQSVTTPNGTSYAIFMGQYSVTPGTHTISVTHDASTNYFEWGWLGLPDLPTTNIVTGSAIARTPIVVSGVIKQYNDANSAATAAYNTIASNVVTSLSAAGINASFADPRPYINASSTAQMNCGSTNPGLHVCRDGAAIWANTLLQAIR
jgi:hypothetical protein